MAVEKICISLPGETLAQMDFLCERLRLNPSIKRSQLVQQIVYELYTRFCCDENLFVTCLNEEFFVPCPYGRRKADGFFYSYADALQYGEAHYGVLGVDFLIYRGPVTGDARA